MSLISIRYKHRSSDDSEFIYTIIDSDFGEIDIGTTAPALSAAVFKMYNERNLPVGRNLALAAIYWCNQSKSIYIDALKQTQDNCCANHIPNWATYAAERDRELEKLLPLL